MNHIKGLRSIFERIHADALLLTSPISQRYAVDYAFTDGYVLITADTAYLVTDFRYKEAAEQAVDPEIRVVAPQSPTEFILDMLRDGNIGTVGFEDRVMTLCEYDALIASCGVKSVRIGQEIEKLRAIKDAEEVSRIRAAQAITDAAYDHILSVMSPNMTEIEVALELEFFMRRRGADAIAFPTIAVSGPASALPHGTPSNTKLRRGFLTMDFGAMLNGYASDMTRTVILGTASSEMRLLYRTVWEAQDLGMQAICAGVSGALVDGAARTHIEARGYKGLFGHSFGHGVGLEIHEEPRLSPRNSMPLSAGNVVTAEPGIYCEGLYGCRIENMGLVTENGFECFTRSKKDMIELF